jgi:small ligand-binding sensory domain FIST
MTQPLVGGLPVTTLREVLKASDDNALAQFMHSYALGFAADQFIAAMNRPNERAAFMIAMAGTYPQDWAAAIQEIAKSGK